MFHLVDEEKRNGDIVLKFYSISAGYGKRVVLQNVSLEVHRNSFTAIMGPNGSGKTTSLLVASGVLRPFDGAVEIMRKPLYSFSRRKLAQTLAVLSQDTVIRFPFTCADIVWMGRYPHRKRFQLPSAADYQAVEWAMKVTNTREFAERLITQTSGGERQRVLLARVLAQQAPVLLLDEPTSAMDVRWTLKSLNLLRKLCLQGLATVVAVMHDINMAALFCSDMVFFKDGQVCAIGKPEKVLTSEILEKVYDAPAIVYRPEQAHRPQVMFLPDFHT